MIASAIGSSLDELDGAKWFAVAIDIEIRVHTYPVSPSADFAAADGKTFDWDWGDGTVERGLTQNPQSHTYANEGNYTILVTGEIASIGASNNSPILTTVGAGSVTAVRFADSGSGCLKKIGNADATSGGVLSNKSGITDITIPDSVEEIGSKAFVYSGIERFLVPRNVSKIGINPFYNLVRGKSVEIDRDNPYYQSGSSIVDRRTGELICCTTDFSYGMPSYDVPAGVKIVGERISRVTGPKELQQAFLGADVETVREMSFYDAFHPSAVRFPVGIYIKSREGIVRFERSPFNESNNIPSGRGLYVPPELVETYEIGIWVGHVFPYLTDTVVEVSVENNRSVRFSHDLSVEGDPATVDFGDGSNPVEITGAGEINHTYPDAGNYAITISGHVKSIRGVIGYSLVTFANDISESPVVSASFGNAIDEIGNDCFAGSNIESLDIPYGVKRIGNYAFYGSELSEVVIPASVVQIGERAFRSTKLYKITSYANPTCASALALDGIPSNCEILVPQELVETYRTTAPWSSRANHIHPID